MTPLTAPPRRPSTDAPAQRPGSVRRTCRLDVAPAGEPRRLHVSAEARDVRLGADRPGARDVRVGAGRPDGRDAPVGAARPEELDGARLTAVVRLEGGRWLDALEVEPVVPGVEALTGLSLVSGFRARAAAVVDGGPLAVLLHDLPTIAYLHGYAMIRGRTQAGEHPGDVVGPTVLPTMADLCSGWRSGGTMATSLAAGQGIPLQDAPPAPDLDRDLDLPELAVGAVRRTRRTDLVPEDGGVRVDAWFRDTYGEPDGGRSVLHEYELSARLVGPDMVIAAIAATPRVLPFPECVPVRERLGRLVGTPAADLRSAVRDRLAGIDGCTHLNDLIVCLAAAATLTAGRVPSGAQMRG